MNIPEISIKKILYTTDLSDSALKAFAYAVSLANRYQASITILHVIAEYADMEARISRFIGKDNMDKLRENRMKEAWETLSGKRRENVMIKEALTLLSDNSSSDDEGGRFVTDEVLVVKGNPVDQILEISRERGYDLIVMGTHGHGPIEDMIGSTARKVLRRSLIPVLAVRLAG